MSILLVLVTNIIGVWNSRSCDWTEVQTLAAFTLLGDANTCAWYYMPFTSCWLLGWPILSKRRKDARLILFYKIINNLAQVPHEHILTKAYEGTRKKNNHKFRHIAVNTSQYRQSFSPKLLVRGISCHSLIPLL